MGACYTDSTMCSSRFQNIHSKCHPSERILAFMNTKTRRFSWILMDPSLSHPHIDRKLRKVFHCDYGARVAPTLGALPRPNLFKWTQKVKRDRRICMWNDIWLKKWRVRVSHIRVRGGYIGPTVITHMILRSSFTGIQSRFFRKLGMINPASFYVSG